VIRVLLADDQALVRDGFRALIDREPDLSAIASTPCGRTGRMSSSWTSACRTSTA
jgi:DNA-binding NarL/FixJ family response regulator